MVWLSVEALRPARHQARRRMEEAALEELAASIREHGVIQPVIVRPAGDGYELVAGERRWRAAMRAGMKEIPALVRALDEREAALVGLVENVQRESLHFLEEAEAFDRVMREFGLTQAELAARMGRSQAFVANRVRLLRLEPRVRELISREMLSERHARALLGLDPEAQARAAEEVARRRLTVRETEALVAGELRRKKRVRVKGVVKDLRIFLNAFREAARSLRAAGVAAEVREEENEREIVIAVRIPKRQEGRGRA